MGFVVTTWCALRLNKLFILVYLDLEFKVSAFATFEVSIGKLIYKFLNLYLCKRGFYKVIRFLIYFIWAVWFYADILHQVNGLNLEVIGNLLEVLYEEISLVFLHNRFEDFVPIVLILRNIQKFHLLRLR